MPITPEQQVNIFLKVPKIANLIDREFIRATGETVPFSLFIWSDDRSQYIANVSRADAIIMMQETLDRFKRHEPDLGPPHEDGQGETRQ